MGILKRIWQDLFESNPEPEFFPDAPPMSGLEEGPQELLDAEARCPESKFVQSCRDFFDDRGFLSAKQLNALTYSGTPNRRRQQFNGWDPQDS